MDRTRRWDGKRQGRFKQKYIFFFHTLDVKPMMPSTHPEFQLWLKKKNLSIKDFSAWVKNTIDPVPFIPWEEDVYVASVFDMVYCFE
jgi:hypothetical protein